MDKPGIVLNRKVSIEVQLGARVTLSVHTQTLRYIIRAGIDVRPQPDGLKTYPGNRFERHIDLFKPATIFGGHRVLQHDQVGFVGVEIGADSAVLLKETLGQGQVQVYDASIDGQPVQCTVSGASPMRIRFSAASSVAGKWMCESLVTA